MLTYPHEGTQQQRKRKEINKKKRVTNKQTKQWASLTASKSSICSNINAHFSIPSFQTIITRIARMTNGALPKVTRHAWHDHERFIISLGVQCRRSISLKKVSNLNQDLFIRRKTVHLHPTWNSILEPQQHQKQQGRNEHLHHGTVALSSQFESERFGYPVAIVYF